MSMKYLYLYPKSEPRQQVPAQRKKPVVTLETSWDKTNDVLHYRVVVCSKEDRFERKISKELLSTSPLITDSVSLRHEKLDKPSRDLSVLVIKDLLENHRKTLPSNASGVLKENLKSFLAM